MHNKKERKEMRKITVYLINHIQITSKEIISEHTIVLFSVIGL